MALGSRLGLATPSPELDIHALFSHYNSLYFDGALSSCFVQWSSPRSRFTSCLATCKYMAEHCQITLSKLLRQCLSADHVKNTLLHEMIHAYLFVTKNERNHRSHGPDFRHIMDSINTSTEADNQRPPFGYKITLFHDFHDEDVVDDHDIAYIWTCKKCGNTIKRATAAPPSHADCIIQAHPNRKTCGLADCRWHRHKVECGGIYINIQKPEEHHDKKKAVSKGVLFVVAFLGQLIDQKSPQATMLDRKGKSVMDLSREAMRFLPSSDDSRKISKSRTSNNEVPRAKQEHFSPNAEEPFRTMKLGVQIDKKPDVRGSEKTKALEKNVITEIRTTSRNFPSDYCPSTNSMKVAPNRRKAELSSPNMFESCSKRKCTRKEINSRECKVVSKWLDYYEDGSTDEEIEPLVNRKIIRARRMKILRESIRREKEEKEKNLNAETGKMLLCSPGFSHDKILIISDDDSS